MKFNKKGKKMLERLPELIEGCLIGDEQILNELLELSTSAENCGLFGSATAMGSSLLVTLVRHVASNPSNSSVSLKTLTNVCNNPANRKLICCQDVSNAIGLLPLLVGIINENFSDDDVCGEVAERNCKPILDLLIVLALDEANKTCMIHTDWLLAALINIFKPSSTCSREMKNMAVSLVGSLSLHPDNRVMMLKLPLSITDALFFVISQCKIEIDEFDSDSDSNSENIATIKESCSQAIWALRSFTLNRRVCMKLFKQTEDLALLFRVYNSPLRSIKFVEHLINICANFVQNGHIGVASIINSGACPVIKEILVESGLEIKKWKSNTKKLLVVLCNCLQYIEFRKQFRSLLSSFLVDVVSKPSNEGQTEIKQCSILIALLYIREDKDTNYRHNLLLEFPSIIEVVDTVFVCPRIDTLCSKEASVRRKDFIPLKVILVTLRDLYSDDDTKCNVDKNNNLWNSLLGLIDIYLNNDRTYPDLICSDMDEKICCSDMLKDIVKIMVLLSFRFKDPENNMIDASLFTPASEKLGQLLGVEAEVDVETNQLVEYLISISNNEEIKMMEKNRKGIYLSCSYHSLNSSTEARAALAGYVIELATKTEMTISSDCGFRGSSDEKCHTRVATVSELISMPFYIYIITNQSRWDLLGRVLAEEYMLRKNDSADCTKLILLLEDDVMIPESTWIHRLHDCGSNISQLERTTNNISNYIQLLGNYNNWNIVEQVQNVLCAHEAAKATKQEQEADDVTHTLHNVVDNMILSNKLPNNDQAKFQQLHLESVTSILAATSVESLISRAVDRASAKNEIAIIKASLTAEIHSEAQSSAMGSFANTFVNAIIDTSCRYNAKFISKSESKNMPVNADTDIKLNEHELVQKYNVDEASIESANKKYKDEMELRESLERELAKNREDMMNLQRRVAEPTSISNSKSTTTNTTTTTTTNNNSNNNTDAKQSSMTSSQLYAATPPASARPLFSSPRSVTLSESLSPASSSSPISPLQSNKLGSIMVNPLNYIRHPLKIRGEDINAMNSLLDGMGITEPEEIVMCDDAEIETIASMLKPLPRKVFLKEIQNLIS